MFSVLVDTSATNSVVPRSGTRRASRGVCLQCVSRNEYSPWEFPRSGETSVMIVNRGNMGEVCVLFVTLLYARGASSAQLDACRTLVQPSDSEYSDCPPLVTTRLLNRNVNQPTNCPRYRRSTTCVLSNRHHQGTTFLRYVGTARMPP